MVFLLGLVVYNLYDALWHMLASIIGAPEGILFSGLL